MAHIRQILANLSISVSDFKKSPKTVIKAAKNEPIAVIIDNKPAFYCVPADILESLYQKVYEMNDMALQNIERLDNDVSSNLNEPPADYDFGVNDVFEAIEDEHEAKRTIHNDSLVDPLNNQVADPLDEEVAHQINLSIDQHLKSLKEKEMYEEEEEVEKEINADDDTTTFIEQAASSNRPNETSILDKINNLDPSLANDFAYPYAQTNDIALGLDSTDQNAMAAANQESSFEGLDDLELVQPDNKQAHLSALATESLNAALTAQGTPNLDTAITAQGSQTLNAPSRAQADLSSSVSQKSLATKRKTTSTSRGKSAAQSIIQSVAQPEALSATQSALKTTDKTLATPTSQSKSKAKARSAVKTSTKTSIKSASKSVDNSFVDSANNSQVALNNAQSASNNLHVAPNNSQVVPAFNTQSELVSDTVKKSAKPVTKSKVKATSSDSTATTRRKKNTSASAQVQSTQGPIAAPNLQDDAAQQTANTHKLQNNVYDVQSSVPEQLRSDFLSAEFSEDKGFAHTDEYELLNDSDIDLSGNEDADIVSEFDIMDDSLAKSQTLDDPNFISDDLLDSAAEQNFLASAAKRDFLSSSDQQDLSSTNLPSDKNLASVGNLSTSAEKLPSINAMYKRCEDDIFDLEQQHRVFAQNKQLEDKAALRAIISDVKQEIRDSEHAKHLVSTPYDMPLEQVARTYSPYQGKIRKTKLTTEENVDPDKTLKALVKPLKASRNSKDKNSNVFSFKEGKTSKTTKEKSKSATKDAAKESKNKDTAGKLSKAKDSKSKESKDKHKAPDTSLQMLNIDNKKSRKATKAKHSGRLTSDMHSAAKRARDIIAQVESKD